MLSWAMLLTIMPDFPLITTWVGWKMEYRMTYSEPAEQQLLHIYLLSTTLFFTTVSQSVSRFGLCPSASFRYYFILLLLRLSSSSSSNLFVYKVCSLNYIMELAISSSSPSLAPTLPIIWWERVSGEKLTIITLLPWVLLGVGIIIMNVEWSGYGSYVAKLNNRTDNLNWIWMKLPVL